MANPIQGEATFGGPNGPLTLRYDFDALCAAEDAAETPLTELLAELGSGKVRAKVLRGLLYGGLQAHHPEISIREAGDLLLSTQGAAGQALEKAIQSGFGANPPKGAAVNGRPPRKKSGTGTSSTHAGASPA